MGLNLKYTFDLNLHELLENPVDVDQHINTLLKSIPTGSLMRSKALGEIGVFLRMRRHLDESQKYLEEAVTLSKLCNDNGRLLSVQKIRLAHVYQWQKKFELSNAIFEKFMQSDEQSIIDFIWQHAGKNYFDQNRYSEALDAFEKALIFRRAKNSPTDQVESTEFAIAVTRKRMNP